MARREAKTVPVHELPTVLVVGCSREFGQRCREAAAKAGAIVRAVEVEMAAAMAGTCHPLAIVILGGVYDAAQANYDELARTNLSNVVRVADEQIAQEELEPAVLTAIAATRQQRGQPPLK